MRLRTLRLVNYRRYRDVFIEWPDGVVAIVGPNGAGKSTLLEATTWALFGHEAARTGKDLLKHTASAPGDDVLVRLEFELDGNAHAVTRRLRGKTLQSDATVETNGKVLVSPGANSSDQAVAYLSRLLGMDREAFHSTIVANQGDLNALSDRTPGARKRLVLGMLGVEQVENAIRLVRAEKRETAARLDESRRSLAREPELRERLRHVETGLAVAQEELATWTQERLDRVQRMEDLAATSRRQDEAQRRYRDLRGRLEGLQRALDATRTQRVRVGAELQLLSQKQAELDRLESQGGRFARLEDRGRQLEAARSAFERRRQLEAELTRLQAEAARWNGHGPAPPAPDGATDAARRTLEQTRSELETSLAEAARLEGLARHVEAEQRRLQAEAVQGQSQWEALAELGPDAPCPTCERPLGATATFLAHRAAEHQAAGRRRLEQLRAESHQLRLQVQTLGHTQEELRRVVADRERQWSEAHALKERTLVARREADQIQAQRVELERGLALVVPVAWDPSAHAQLDVEREAHQRWRESVARTQESLQRAPRLRDELSALAAEEERTRTDIMAASRELGTLAYVEGEAEKARAGALEARDRVHEAERELTRLRERSSVLEETRVACRRDVDHLDALRRDLGGLEERLRIEDHLAADFGDKGLLPDFKNHLIARIRPALARVASGLVAEMTGGRYTDVELDEDYALHVFDGGHAWPLARFSGGESDVMNLALRLAISELVAAARGTTRIQFVALDEVLANQDETRRRSVLHGLRGLRHHFRQVLLVTHWDEVREGVDNVLRVLPQSDGTSRLWTSWSAE